MKSFASFDRTDTIYAVRRDSPLIAAQGDGECFIASDIPAILSYTRDYYLMDTDEIAELKNGVIRFFDLSGKAPDLTLDSAIHLHLFSRYPVRKPFIFKK